MANQQQAESILGFPIVLDTKDRCTSLIVKWLGDSTRCRYFVCANPHSLLVAISDPDFRVVINSADMVTPDGIGIVLASRILGGNILERVTGSDVFLGLSEKLNIIGGYSYFFLGSTEMTLTRIRRRMSVDFPRIAISGIFSPPFKSKFSDDDENKMINAVNTAKPDILWVGMTAPKQEKWIYRNRHRLKVKFVGAIGAAFDFYAGTVTRSHPFFQRCGLEWFPRLFRQPRRLWRRNFVSSPLFLLHVIKERIAHMRQG